MKNELLMIQSKPLVWNMVAWLPVEFVFIANVTVDDSSWANFECYRSIITVCIQQNTWLKKSWEPTAEEKLKTINTRTTTDFIPAEKHNFLDEASQLPIHNHNEDILDLLKSMKAKWKKVFFSHKALLFFFFLFTRNSWLKTEQGRYWVFN